MALRDRLQEDHVNSKQSPIGRTSLLQPPGGGPPKQLTRKDSISLLLEPGSNCSITSLLLDLTQQDFEVNAPVTTGDLILQGEELLTALELSGAQM